MPTTVTTFASSSRPRTPPSPNSTTRERDLDASSTSPSSPSYAPTSSHTGRSSPDPDNSTSLSIGPVNKEFRPAPSFSIARAPRYPGWKPPDLTTTPAVPALKPNGSPVSPPRSAIATPSWTPGSSRFTPSKPLSPNHLARIANAFGVQVPMPPSVRMASESASTGTTVGARSGSALSNARPDNSNTTNIASNIRPSSANSTRSSPRTGTKFLIYVVPPTHLSDPSSVNQFRRGALVPLHATLSSQLTAIAKEWSLPSTVGLVVYLLDIKHDMIGDEPIGEEWLGPKIGDDAWKLLWSGMLKVEREEFERTMALSRQQAAAATAQAASAGGITPSFSAPFPLKLGSAALLSASPPESIQSLPSPSPTSSSPSTSSDSPPQQPQQLTPPKSALVPLITADARMQQRSPSPFTDTMRSESPAGSVRTMTTAVSPMLPSLPIVGKIEFDIDRARATWYEGWATRRPRSRTDSGGDGALPIPLQLGTASAKIGGSRRLPPSPLQGLTPAPDLLGAVTVEDPKSSPSVLTSASGAAAFFPVDGEESPPEAVEPEASPEWSEEEVEEDAETTDKLPRDSLLLTVEAEEAKEEPEEEQSLDDAVEVSPPVVKGYEQLEEDDDKSASEVEKEETPLPSGSEDEEDEDESVGHISLAQMVVPGEDDSQVFSTADSSIAGVRLRGAAQRDPLSDVFPSDAETWSEMQSESQNLHNAADMSTAPSSESSHALHSDSLEDYVPRLSGESDFTEELPLPQSTADDFQEVLDMLNSKSPLMSGGLSGDTTMNEGDADLSQGAFPIPPSMVVLPPPPIQLRSPIILDEHAPKSPDSVQSQRESVTSGESGRSRRPAPLILGPTDKIPSILEGLQPTPPGNMGVHTIGGLPVLATGSEPGTPQPRPQSTLSDGDPDYFDEIEQEKAMKKQLDELERSISSLSPRELAPTPVFGERSPVERNSRRGTPNLNGIGGPRFRSEALGAELANKMAGREASSTEASRSASPNWPSVPFEKASPVLPSSSAQMSEETRTRSRLAAEEEGIAATAKKYRPPTPAAGRGENQNPMDSAGGRGPPVSVVTAVPARMSGQPSPKSSSRFSADSAASDDPGRTLSVGKSLRKLWRKSGAAAQATVRLNAAKQNGGPAKPPGRDSPPPPVPAMATPTQASMSSRPDSRTGERPDSSGDPFFFDHQSRYPTIRGPAGSRSPPRNETSKPQQTPTSLKTRSILKGRRTSPPPLPPTPTESEKEKERGFAGLFQRRSNATSRSSPTPEDDPGQPRSRKSPPSALAGNVIGLVPGGQKLSPSAFPRTASSRTSFEVEETTFRPSMDSGDPLTPRLSQFEMVSPPGRSFELEEDDRRWPR